MGFSYRGTCVHLDVAREQWPAALEDESQRRHAVLLRALVAAYDAPLVDGQPRWSTQQRPAPATAGGVS
jgi:hypothetical protein